MKNLLIRIAQALVDNPKKVRLNEIRGSQTVVLELRVADTDMGRIIGKKGNVAKAIRAILTAAFGKVGKRYVLEIVEWCSGPDSPSITCHNMSYL